MGNSLQHDWGGLDLVVNKLRVGAATSGAQGTEMTGAEITVLDGVTAGTATASKAVVLDSSKGIATITSATITTLTAPTIAGATTYSGAATFSSTIAATGAITPTGGVAASGGFSATPRTVSMGNIPLVSTDGTDSTPVTTETYVSEVFVPCNMTITGVALFNGSNVTGNVTVGLADSTGAPIAAAKSASTAGSGTDAYQRIPFAVAYAATGPATYYVQVQYDSGTARYNTHTIGNHGVTKQTSQSYGTFASFTPPTTFTTALGNMGGLY